MKTITQIREEIAEFMKKLGDMRAKCINEKRDPNEVERNFAHETIAKIEDLEDQEALELKTQQTLDRAKRSTEPPDKTPVDTTKDVKVQERRDSFVSFGEMLQAVMRAESGTVDPRLSKRAATGLSESVPSDGGYLVDVEMAGGIIKTVWNSFSINILLSQT